MGQKKKELEANIYKRGKDGNVASHNKFWFYF